MTDNGGTANGGVIQTTTTFTVTVLPVDVPPTLNFITNPAPVGVSPGLQRINLTGIGPGAGDTGQFLTVTATSNNPALIPNPTIAYTSPNTTGTLTYTPVTNATGTALITITVTDNGDTTFGGSNTYQQTFTVAVAPSHVAPVITTTTGVLAFTQGDQATPIDPNLTITATNSPTIASVTVQIIGNFNPTEDVLDWTDPTGGLVTDGPGFDSSTGTLILTAVPGASVTPAIFQQAAAAVTYQDTNISSPLTLTRTVEFTVDDGAGTNNTASAVKLISVSTINFPPIIDPISPPSITILENSPVVTIPLSGINAGGGQLQNLTVSVKSFTGVNDTPGLIPNPTLFYTSPNTYGSFTFQPAPFATGTSTITVTVTDSLNQTSIPVTLFVTVAPVNQAPTLGAITNPAPFTEFVDSPTVVPPIPAPINLTGITSGTGDSQNLTVTARVESTA